MNKIKVDKRIDFVSQKVDKIPEFNTLECCHGYRIAAPEGAKLLILQDEDGDVYLSIE